MRHVGAYSVTYIYFNMPTKVNQVVLAATVILKNACRAWTMYLCLDSLKFVLNALGPSTL